jgi:sugar phosphate permease
VASCYDIGSILGGLVLGYISDKMYSRRIPITVVAILLSGIL